MNVLFSRPLSARSSTRILLFVAAIVLNLRSDLPLSSGVMFARLSGVLIGIAIGLGF